MRIKMRTNTLATLSGLALSALLLAGAGCASTTTTVDTNANVNTTTVVVDDDADDVDEVDEDTAIEISSPEDGDTVATTFDLEVEIDDFTLAPDKVEGANAEGEGHYHVWVDGEYFVAGVAAVTSVAGLEVGEHELMVSLQNNDHTDLAPVVKSEAVTVTVE